MAEDGTRTQRASALEEKKRRLEDLKKRREQRGGDAAVNNRAGNAANLDEYIDGLLGEQQQDKALPPSSQQQQQQNGNASSSATAGASSSETMMMNGDAKSVAASAATTSSNVFAAESVPTLPAKIMMVETFTIGTQTEIEDVEDLQEGEEDPLDHLADDDAAGAEPKGEDVDGSKQHTMANAATAHGGRRDETSPSAAAPKVLTSEEVMKTVSSKPFSSFINTASKKVERVLGAPILSDLLVDYLGGAATADANKSSVEAKDITNSKYIQSQQIYECAKWTEQRDVTDIDWSPLHRELILTTYHLPSGRGGTGGGAGRGETAVSAISAHHTLSSSVTPRSSELQSDGLALIWSLAMPHRPEHIFTCGSPVTSGRFHPTDPTLIIGGCESGQLVVWDIRSGRLPVQKSALSTVAGANAKGHTHPIASMEIIEGGSGLVTASGDGRMNFWSLSNLREPAESIQIGTSISTFAVSPESESILVGDEQGTMYTVAAPAQTGGGSGGQRSSRRQAKKMATVDEEGENHGHYGLITSLAAKSLKKGATTRAAGLSKGFLRGSGGLTLSAGVDWTVKLWAPAYTDRPLVSFVSHSYDYMSDVMWNPAHPTLFATASSSGSIGLWNLAHSFEEPITDQDGITIETERGLNKLKWSLDGRRLAAASSDRVHVVSLADDIVRAKGDEDSKVMNHLLSRGLIDRA